MQIQARFRSGLRSCFGAAATVLVLGSSSVLALDSLDTASAAKAAADYVDPFIGTDGHGHTYPGATLPFGMVQLSPDTRLEGWDGCSGYHFTDDVIYGFSHTHLSGTGVSDYGDILLMPGVGEPVLDNGYIRSGDYVNGGDWKGPTESYGSRFRKSTERAQAGYYAVHLDDPGFDVELTSTERVGFHRYRTTRSQPAHVVVDLRHRDRLLAAKMRVVNDREIEGFRHSTAWAKNQKIFFVARFSRPFDPRGFVDLEGGRSVELSDDRAVGALDFGDLGSGEPASGEPASSEPFSGEPASGEPAPGELLVKVGISAVDIEGARANLEAELSHWDFDRARRQAREIWSEALGKIEVDGGTEDERTSFFTGLYHSLIAPNLYSDIDGRYRGLDDRIHRAEGRRHYTVFSLWDTFRATHPLYNLIEPKRNLEFIQTFLDMYRQGGRLPVWELAANETDTMIGYHSVSVISEAWQKGIRDFDAELALEAMVASADLDHFGLDAYRRQGFIGSRDEGESVSKTLEYAYDDFCIARFAAHLGRSDVETRFMKRSQGWRHLLDPETGFMRPKRNQRFIEPFDPYRVDNHYTEANSWQYSFFVPHDVHGLIRALGGDERFIDRLDALFAADSATTGRTQVDITGLIGQYAQGNEPSHHAAFLYHYAGRPDRSAEWARRIVDELYTARPDGLSGNEDCGQMSSWYVFVTMGLYPVNPCDPTYVIVPPIFERTELRLPVDHNGTGRSFTLRTEGEGSYIVSAALNGEAFDRSFLHHHEIIAGGELILRLGSKPGTWGTAPADRPGHGLSPNRRLPTVPYVVGGQDVFRGQQEIDLVSAEPGATVFRSINGSPFEAHGSPFTLTENTTLRLYAELEGRKSPTVEAQFHRMPNDWRVSTAHEPNASYTAGGPDALIDGLRGETHWRTGRWQGYQLTDFEATVDLGEIRPLHRVGANFLQDIKSWIWFPTAVTISVAERSDGPFRHISELGHNVSDGADGSNFDHIELLEMISEPLLDVEARFVRFHARNYGPIPEWHPGYGGLSFIFVDELILE